MKKLSIKSPEAEDGATASVVDSTSTEAAAAASVVGETSTDASLTVP